MHLNAQMVQGSSLTERFEAMSWPLGLTFFLRRSSRKGPLLAWTLVLATASALAMTLLYQPGGDSNRVCYGTDTRAFSLLQSSGSVQQIVLVNTRMSRPWQDTVNQSLAQVAAIFPKVTLVNWYDASAGKGSYFYPDGVHLDSTDAQYYALLLAKAVETQKLPL
ncbi:hypothetical protein D2Q93_04690 [Alicyclobacillaceae bacterium I2511]|nr:hypothetical protein D2Q93_04690 [Alicyclobacillaceae bacterium I2511]